MLPTPTPFAERRLAMLERLAELGMVMAERLAATPEPTGDEALKFLRVAKAVRQTLALHAQMEAEVQTQLIRVAQGQAKEKQAERQRRKNRTVSVVERLIETETGDDSDRADEIGETFYDWQLACDDEDFGLDKPFGEAVAAICNMLGLTPDWTRYADEDWARDLLTDPDPPPDPSPGGSRPDRTDIRSFPPEGPSPYPTG